LPGTAATAISFIPTTIATPQTTDNRSYFEYQTSAQLAAAVASLNATNTTNTNNNATNRHNDSIALSNQLHREQLFQRSK
jgi:hypothetical protein